MTTGMRRLRIALALAVLAATSPAFARQERSTPDYTPKPGILALVSFDQKPGAQIPLKQTFRDEAGKTIALKDVLRGKPVILNLVYFDCPLLCNQVLDALVRSLNVLKYKIGKDFDVLSVSIDPREDSQKALEKKADVLRRYTMEGAQAREGWHFLTGDEPAIQALAASVGFRYSYNAQLKQYAHPAGIVFLTPDGRASRYIYGLSFPARDLTLALTEASNGKIGGVIEQALLLCYVYDPNSASYSFAIMRVIQVLGTITALLLFSYLFRMLRRDRREALKMASRTAAMPPQPMPLN
jgi:protein SCO1